jgi:hypothetical protein
MTDQNLGYAEPLKVRGSCSWDPATASTEDVFCAMWAFRETAKKMRQSKIQSQPKKHSAQKTSQDQQVDNLVPLYTPSSETYFNPDSCGLKPPLSGWPKATCLHDQSFYTSPIVGFG